MEATPSTPWLRFRCDERIGNQAVQHDFALRQQWTSIFGASGSGKTTLLRIVAGLLPQGAGTCTVLGRDLRGVPAHQRRIALVEQSPALFPHLNVERNVAFGSGSTRKATEMVEAALRDFHLVPLRSAAIHTLSGGERQRVAIARALCSAPRALLLDEVFTGMDAGLRSDLIATLHLYRERLQLPILSVTHDIGEAFATADEVLRLHDGKIVGQGAPAEVLQEDRATLIRALSSAGQP